MMQRGLTRTTIVVLALLATTAAVAGEIAPRVPAGKIVRLTGYVVDEQCRKPHTADSPCGVDQAAPNAKLMFLDTKGELYLIQDQEKAVDHVGREISVFGLVRGDAQLWLLEVTRYIDPEGDAIAAQRAAEEAEQDGEKQPPKLKPRPGG